MYITALSMYRSFAPVDQIDGPLLWRAWAEMEWEEGKPLLALKVLVAASATEIVDLGKTCCFFCSLESCADESRAQLRSPRSTPRSGHHPLKSFELGR